MNDFVKGEIAVYCMMVQRGRPAANLPIQERFAKEVTKEIEENYKLRVYKEYLSEGWLSLWIYNHSHVLGVIKSLPKIPETLFDHWVLGKLFGYDENSIKEFLAQR